MLDEFFLKFIHYGVQASTYSNPKEHIRNF